VPDRDYSATPLGRKLGAKPGVGVLVFFTTSRAELEARFGALEATLAPADGLWVAWPKKAAQVETDLDFAAVQALGLAHGLVDNKSASIDETWQALRFVHRKANRSREGGDHERLA
jgi:hypothetical protein